MSRITINVDEKLKNEATAILNEMGMDLTTGIKVYLNQVVRDRALPFTPSLKEDSLQARRDIENGNTLQFEDLDAFKQFVNEL